MISIVTGTLNRVHLLPDLIKNTVDSNERLELVLVDGGSIDGTIEYIKNLNHERIKFIEVGERSYYPHFMNLGIENSKFEYVCQWNDDVLLIDSWNDVISELEEGYDFYLFNWKYGVIQDIENEDWITGKNHYHPNKGWCIFDESTTSGHIVMNYGIYNKKIFREIGMYRNEFTYYWADSDMSRRANMFGYKHKALDKIKVCALTTDKRAIDNSTSESTYYKCVEEYKNKILGDQIPFLKK
jgi:glycosyltransferase involved in cell wall biosynthesis